MITLGIVGWGYWGRNYAKYLDTTIDAQLQWVVDLRPEMLADAKKCYPHFNVTQDIKDLVKHRVDGVIIAVPASIHYKVASYFIEQGIPILVEKPLTHTARTARALHQLATKKKAKVLVGHTFLYNQATRWIKQKIETHYFGDIHYLEFKRQSFGPIRDDVNIIWDFAPHDIALATWFLGGASPHTVHAQAKSYSRNNQEDIAIITLEYPNNILVNINVAWLYPVKIRNMVLLGSKRMALFEDTNPIEPLRIYDASVQYPHEADPYGASFRLGDVLIPRVKSIDPLYTQLKHFVEYIKDKEQPLTPISEGVKNVLLLEAIQESLKKQKSIVVKKIS